MEEVGVEVEEAVFRIRRKRERVLVDNRVWEVLGRKEEGGEGKKGKGEEEMRDSGREEMRMKGGLWCRLLIMFRLLGRMFECSKGLKDGSLGFNVF
jgi:hypothetical protein